MSSYLEELSSQIPAAQTLINLGYTYLTPDQTLDLRGGLERNVLLEDVLVNWLTENNQVAYKGEIYSFSDSAIQEAFRKISTVNLNDGLIRANEQIYDLLTLGISLPQTIEGDRRHYSLNYIDWKDPSNNVYHVTEEFVVEREGSHQTRRPDLVCFVNGIPFAVIECKRPDLKVKEGGLPYEEAVSQNLRNQKTGEIRSLFAYSQLLLAVSTNHAAYATTGTPKEFWAVWREEEPESCLGAFEQRVSSLINIPLQEERKADFYEWREGAGAIRVGFENKSDRLPTEQDRALVSLLAPERLLEIAYQFIVFDGGVKKIARYQQYYAVKAVLDRVANLNAQGERTGGVIWHTTGSGKSLSMVMIAKALALHPNIKNPRIILVTDRINLDAQIYGTFKSCGKDIVQAQSGRHLLDLVSSEKADIIATVINKFETVADGKETNHDPNVFVLVDESHRGQYGEIHSKMRRVFTKGCYIGFTGTPLTKKGKSTARQFGSFIHKYPMRTAVDDKVVVPLLYEGRLVDMEPHQAQLDRWFERHTADLTEEQKADLKSKMSAAEVVNDVERRVQEIAFNLSEHFSRNFKDPVTGYKAQLATSSKRMALLYKKHLDACGLLTSEVVISAPDTREGHEDINTDHLPEDQAFWEKMMERFGTEEAYNREILEDFSRSDGVDLLIVVDKLLVGFDEPRNTVLYIDKSLKDHAILQAIARVNRLFEGKEFGLIVDYRGILGELNEAINTYDALAEFDPEDVQDTFVDVTEEINKLPDLHSGVWAVFNGVNRDDNEALERFLAPEDKRQEFYDALARFAKTLKIALASVVFYEKASESQIKTYKRDLKFFHNLRMSVKLRYAETIDFRDYEQKIRKLLDEHIDAEGVRQLTGEVEIFDPDQFDELVDELSTPRAKAEAILNRLKKTAYANLERDPAYYRKFSQMIEDTLRAIEEGRLIDLEALEQAQDFQDEYQSGYRQDIPEKLRSLRDASAYYGVVKDVLSDEIFPEEIQVDIAIEIERIIEEHKIVDWTDNRDVRNEMWGALEDYLYHLSNEKELSLEPPEMDQIIGQVLDIARKRA